jgi:sugar phosphate isomerase/epimerase
MPVRRGLATPADADYREAIPTVADLDLEFVELAMEGQNRPVRVHDEAGEVNALAATERLELVVALPFGLDLASPHSAVRRSARETYEDAIEAAVAAGAEKAILRAQTGAYRPAYGHDDLREEFVETVLDLDSYAAHAGLELCVENYDELVTVRAGLPELFENGVGVCLNTARAFRRGTGSTDQATLLLERPELVSHLHLTDVSAGGDRVPFGTGAIDFERLLNPVGDAWHGTLSLVDFEGWQDSPAAVRRLGSMLQESS